MKTKGKKMKNLLLLVIAACACISSFAQVNVSDLGFGYSALVRDTAGRIQTNKPVKLKFTLLIGQNGTEVNSPWVEEHNTSTDGFGFVNVTIGRGTKIGGVSSNFAGIDFTLANYWILVEVYNNFLMQYEPLAKTAMQAVPYAKVAGQLASGSAVPPGTIVAFAGPLENIPEGWLLCDGASLNAADPRYVRLFNAIGTSWGSSGGPGTFQVPFTNGMFLRGVAYGAGNDPDKDRRVSIPGGSSNAGNRVGSYQADQFRSHSHPPPPGYTSFAGDATPQTVSDVSPIRNNLRHLGYYSRTGDSGGNETRPANVYVNYIIKL